jgi:hypothetical protein
LPFSIKLKFSRSIAPTLTRTAGWSPSGSDP